MSTESKQTRRTLIETVPALCGQAIESPMTAPGIADVWFGPCAVECKYLPTWPGRPSTPVNLRCPVSINQFRWLNRRYKAGFAAWVMLQANKREWLLFAAPDSYVLCEGHTVTRLELYRKATRRWTTGLVADELHKALLLSVVQIEADRYSQNIVTAREIRI